jgi:hypothetical protein
MPRQEVDGVSTPILDQAGHGVVHEAVGEIGNQVFELTHQAYTQKCFVF